MLSTSPRKRVAVALSGGVDSLCALLLLKKAGFHVLALHGRLIDDESFAIKDLGDLCARLSVELHVVDLRQVFERKLLDPFAQAWISGQTPNPCSLCNREIKFGALAGHALELGADFFATGHYARTFHHPVYGRQVLGPAADQKKDQSYFLSLVQTSVLDRLLFPLAGLCKDECKAIVRAAGLSAPAARESQDICFLAKGEKHADFVQKWAESRFFPKAEPGPIYILEKDKSSKMRKIPAGRHKGLWHYTIGQRKGLGVPYSEALYVLSRDLESGSLFLAPRSALMLKNCRATSLNIFVPEEQWPEDLFSRLRYRQKPARASACIRDNMLYLEFVEPQFPGAEGQLATVEDKDGIILAAGIIEQMHFVN